MTTVGIHAVAPHRGYCRVCFVGGSFLFILLIYLVKVTKQESTMIVGN